MLTINRSGVLETPIAYNVHDGRGITRYDEMAEQARSIGVKPDKLTDWDPEVARYPFLWTRERNSSIICGRGAVNAGYREAPIARPVAARQVVERHRLGTGPFAAGADRIKQRRSVRMSA